MTRLAIVSSYAQAAGLSLPPAPTAPSPEQLQLVADNVPHLVSYVDTSGRVLVVDDSADNAESLSQILRAMRHETETAFDGPSAVAAAERFTPDVMLLDIGLPGFDAHLTKPVDPAALPSIVAASA